jgi:spore coat polysaccharide biosynthesis protein SpsF
MNYIGLITVRTSSSRLKNKCLLYLNKKIRVIEHIILRCIDSDLVPILCTSKNKSDDILIEIAKKFKIKYFRGSEKNKILRWYNCAKNYKLKYFHTVDADDLYFDPVSIKKSIELAINKRADLIHPSKISRFGGASEGYTFSIGGIEKLKISLKNYSYKNINSFDTEMIDTFVEGINLKEYTLKGQPYEYKDKIRFTLDYKDDFKMFKILFKRFGTYEKRKIINDYLRKNKKILKMNYFKNMLWLKKQKKFIKPKKKLN